MFSEAEFEDFRNTVANIADPDTQAHTWLLELCDDLCMPTPTDGYAVILPDLIDLEVSTLEIFRMRREVRNIMQSNAAARELAGPLFSALGIKPPQ